MRDGTRGTSTSNWIAGLVLALPFALVAGCRQSGPATAHEESSTVPIVSGTVLDAATSEPVRGARITGPNERSATSDEHGRFTLTGLPLGATGEVRASLDDGRAASVTLRRLAPGRLEVVLYVR